MSSPLVTIGIAVFNAEDTIVEAIESALSQTWSSIEIILVDDCSTDSSIKILEDYETRFEEIRLIKFDINKGVAESRNQLINQARGEFLAFFDDDDVSIVDRIELQLNCIQKYEESCSGDVMVICHSSRRLIYADGDEQIAGTMGTDRKQSAPSGITVAERILIGVPLKNGYGALPTCSQMARLTTYKKLNGFDPAFRRSEDTDFNIRLAKEGGHFIGIEKPLVIQQMTKTPDKNLRDEYMYAKLLLDKHKEIPDRYGLYDYCCKWLEIKQAWLEKKYYVYLTGLFVVFAQHPVLTVQRMSAAVPNMLLNKRFSQFHMQDSQ